ncbi:TetR/AcrR family transcriptional regulator [Evansella halocellulosilytica]|uniref:TetR/AcrR family transcriptional regulator n=1 Tax=Evansella halocellulosilytica TaxID=2011013 RepID=UPI0015CE13AD|nr:TetR/AcrR family transcriptional regulator [Evansella halocellulosilytica]
MNAAIEEFVNNGYEQTSTNTIVKKAGIGKGTLFHYFNSKKDLFLYLLDHCIEVSKKEYIDLIDTNEGDIIKRFRHAAHLKKDMITKYPYMTDFMLVAFLSSSKDIVGELQERRVKVEAIGTEKLYSNIDKSLFRDEMDVDKAMKLMIWALEGYRVEKERQVKEEKSLSNDEYKDLFDEFDDYLEVLKQAFYK